MTQRNDLAETVLQKGAKTMTATTARFLSLIATLSLMISLSSCGEESSSSTKSKRRSPPNTKQAGKNTGSTAANTGYGPTGGKVDMAAAGSIKGVVKFEGDAPKPAALDMSKDQFCAQHDAVHSEKLLVDPTGGLKDVVVHLVGLDEHESSFPVPSEAARLVQSGCRYEPHVLTLRVGQELAVINADNTNHNYHFIGRYNDEINRTQPKPMKHDGIFFEHAESGAQFSCDVHGWMKAKVHIFRHPCFTVSAANGSFEISGVPPGKYQVIFAHESFGKKAKEMDVTVAAKAVKELGTITISE